VGRCLGAKRGKLGQFKKKELVRKPLGFKHKKSLTAGEKAGEQGEGSNSLLVNEVLAERGSFPVRAGFRGKKRSRRGVKAEKNLGRVFFARKHHFILGRGEGGEKRLMGRGERVNRKKCFPTGTAAKVFLLVGSPRKSDEEIRQGEEDFANPTGR